MNRDGGLTKVLGGEKQYSAEKAGRGVRQKNVVFSLEVANLLEQHPQDLAIKESEPSPILFGLQNSQAEQDDLSLELSSVT